jgi:pimeloyl-ACP methyl ester carboxylesterase
MTKKWIDKTDPNPSMTFSCVANVGTSGPSHEMPLAAIRDAFEDRIADGTNAGFRRPDALLAIVVLTDENDCSYEQPVTLGFGQVICQSGQEPVGSYVGFLDTFTGNHSRWATAVIAGERDTLIPPTGTEALRRKVPNLVFDRSIAGAGHNDIDERPEFRQAMREAIAVVKR